MENWREEKQGNEKASDLMNFVGLVMVAMTILVEFQQKDLQEGKHSETLQPLIEFQIVDHLRHLNED